MGGRSVVPMPIRPRRWRSSPRSWLVLGRLGPRHSDRATEDQPLDKATVTRPTRDIRYASPLKWPAVPTLAAVPAQERVHVSSDEDEPQLQHRHNVTNASLPEMPKVRPDAAIAGVQDEHGPASSRCGSASRARRDVPRKADATPVPLSVIPGWAHVRRSSGSRWLSVHSTRSRRCIRSVAWSSSSEWSQVEGGVRRRGRRRSVARSGRGPRGVGVTAGRGGGEERSQSNGGDGSMVHRGDSPAKMRGLITPSPPTSCLMFQPAVRSSTGREALSVRKSCDFRRNPWNWRD
jgi:hypothetical protein